MKPTTKDWLTAAEDDLLSAKKLVTEARLTHVVAFHCQQCIEKSFKGLIEEQNQPSVKSHDLLRLKKLAGIALSEKESTLLSIINEVYIDARYPGDFGLLPNGKPEPGEVQNFIEFSEKIYNTVKKSMD